jgi:hypothetical protein
VSSLTDGSLVANSCQSATTPHIHTAARFNQQHAAVMHQCFKASAELQLVIPDLLQETLDMNFGHQKQRQKPVNHTSPGLRYRIRFIFKGLVRLNVFPYELQSGSL